MSSLQEGYFGVNCCFRTGHFSFQLVLGTRGGTNKPNTFEKRFEYIRFHSISCFTGIGGSTSTPRNTTRHNRINTMSHWMISGASRLQAKHKQTFQARAQQRATVVTDRNISRSVTSLAKRNQQQGGRQQRRRPRIVGA